MSFQSFQCSMLGNHKTVGSIISLDSITQNEVIASAGLLPVLNDYLQVDIVVKWIAQCRTGPESVD